MNGPYPSSITTTSDLANPHLVQTWRNPDGGVRAQVDLGGADLTFRPSADADAVAAAVTEARDALRAMEAEQIPGQATLGEVTPDDHT